jgi:8-oxo-dGTP pyrophosphatase MutT (NUDIX family)
VHTALAEYVRGLVPAARERVIWPSATEFEVTSYLSDREPPATLVTSVRAVVRRGTDVLVFDDQGGESHLLPGGRLERGESLLVALERELIEEIGCAVTNSPRLIGTMHFHRLTKLPETHQYFGSDPDFLQAIFDVTTADDPIEPVGDPWVLQPRFVSVREIDRLPLHVVERAFLVQPRRKD